VTVGYVIEKVDLLSDAQQDFEARVLSCDAPAPAVWHVHDGFEVLVVLSGHYRRHLVGFVLSCEPGDVLLCPRWEPHGGETTASADTTLLSILFRPEFLAVGVLGDLPWPAFFAAMPGDRPRVMGEEMREQVLATAAEMRREIEEKDQGWSNALRLGLSRLLLILGRRWTGPMMGPANSAAPVSRLARIRPALDLVQSQHGRPVRVDEAAAACHLSSGHFAWNFRRAIGMSFGKFVLRFRLAYVAQLVLAGEQSLDEIAELLEFTDRSHLHHCFVKCYGCTPGQYRARAFGLAE
jgi:AraC-like DNA-binding protein/quercetin dioxygenase-like cupin family protein